MTTTYHSVRITNLEVVVLPLLLSLEVQPSETTQVLLAHRFVDGSSATDTFSVVVSRVRPPVSLHLHIPEDHVLDRRRQPRHLPRNVGLPTTPRFRQMLENRLRLVLLDSLRHHVEDVVHD